MFARTGEPPTVYFLKIDCTIPRGQSAPFFELPCPDNATSDPCLDYFFRGTACRPADTGHSGCTCFQNHRALSCSNSQLPGFISTILNSPRPDSHYSTSKSVLCAHLVLSARNLVLKLWWLESFSCYQANFCVVSSYYILLSTLIVSFPAMCYFYQCQPQLLRSSHYPVSCHFRALPVNSIPVCYLSTLVCSRDVFAVTSISLQCSLHTRLQFRRVATLLRRRAPSRLGFLLYALRDFPF